MEQQSADLRKLEITLMGYSVLGHKPTDKSARILLEGGIADLNSGDYSVATILFGFASQIYQDVCMQWEASIANGWYESAMKRRYANITRI